MNSRSHVPTVDGARTPSNSAGAAPARSTSVSSMQSPPASAAPTTVNAFEPEFPAPCPDNVTWASTSSATPNFWASTPATASPPLGSKWFSSKLTDTRARLCDAFIEQVPSDLGITAL